MEQSDFFMEDLPETNPEGFFNEVSNQNACSVRVAVRVRPLIGLELKQSGAAGTRTCVSVSEQENILQIGDKQFQFDRVFGQESPQQEIFDVCARNLVLGCFVGYNATIVAYGQTGSGKTHTMGTQSTQAVDEDAIGIVPRVFKFIFEELERKKKQSSLSDFTIKISFLELYNEDLHDLLDPLTIGAVDKVTGKPMKELFIKEKGGSIYIQGLKEEIVNSKEECIELLNKGISHRTTSATMMNEGSSRSHAIFTVSIEQRIVKDLDVQDGQGENKEEVTRHQEEHITAKFHFVDLAGSERIKRTMAVGKQMREGININKGLLCLGNVISALTDENKKDKHIPYRDSKLTRILQDSLGGNSRTTVIACVSPAETNYEESLNSIKYASRARNIKNKAVVNRDANSLLIDSLRGQISKLQGEISEYQRILTENGVAIPADFKESAARKVEEQRKSPSRTAQSDQDTAYSLLGSTMGGSQELREVKIKLSKKEHELKAVKESLTALEEKLALRDSEFAILQKERDTLRLKNEMMSERLEQSGITIDQSQFEEATNQSKKLIQEYQEGLEKLQIELDKKKQEYTETWDNLKKLSAKKQVDDQLLNKKVEEISILKNQLKKLQATQQNGGPQQYSPQKQSISSQPKFKLNLQELNSNSSGQKPIPNFVMLDAEGVQKKFIDNLSIQLDSLFSEENTGQSSQRSPRRSRTPAPEDLLGQHPPSSSDDEFTPAENEDSLNKNLEDKEKILSLAKSSAAELQSKLVEMMKHQYEQQAKQIENTMKTIDSEKQATLKKTTDSKQIQQIESQYKQKMEELARQLQTAKEKEKQQQQMTKQISISESKIKNLEDDVVKMRKSKETLEKQIKSETDKHAKFKQKFEKDLINAKKAMTDKERELQKIKHDLKKTDQQMNSKISELRAMQKRVYEERYRREIEKKEELDKKGIDVDRIKVWITQNTDKMLRFRELQEAMTKHTQEKTIIEDEMFQEGDKLNQLMVEKERKEIEKQQLELIAVDQEEPDEGPILELEEEIYKLVFQIEQINERLETLEETYDFQTNKLDQLNSEAISLDAENIEPLKLTGLHSIDAARVTLQTILSILLDVNIYNRDLEYKCIELDEQILELNSTVAALQSRVEELTLKLTNQGGSLLSDAAAQAKQNANKEKVMLDVVSQAMGDFVEYENIKNLGLTPGEKTAITKLSLAKIMKNIKKELEEEKKRSHNLTIKLENALSDKDQFRLKFDNLRKKVKDDVITKDPLNLQNVAQSQPPQLETPKQFMSLAAARASKRQQTTTKAPGDADTSKPNSSTPNTQGGKHRSRLTVPTKAEDPEAVQTKQTKFALQGQQQSARLTNKKQSFLIPSSAKRSRSNSKDEASSELKQQSKTPNYMAPRKVQAQNSGLPQVGLINKKPGTGPQLRTKQPQISDDVQVLNQQDSTQIDQPVGRVVVPSLKDRRNMRKMVQDDSNNTGKVSQDIDKIKEATQQITSNQSHYDRRESRARDYNMKMQNERAFSSGRGGVKSAMGMASTPLDMNNLNDLEEDENEDSPRDSPQKMHTMGTPAQEIESNSYYEEEGFIQEPKEFDVQTMNHQKKFMGKWSYEELAEIENEGHKLIGTDVINGQIVLVFEDFMVRQIDLITLAEQHPRFNILQVNNLPNVQEPAIDFVLDRELDLIAIPTSSTILIFDMNFECQGKIDVGAGIVRVLFCAYHIVSMIIANDELFIVSYQLGDWQELGMYQLNMEDQCAVILRTDNTYVYLALGIKVAKLQVPDMSTVFVIETEHQSAIIDIALTPEALVTTSLDKSVNVSSIKTGEQCMNSLEEFECDHLESCDDFILARIQEGSQYIILRYYQGAPDLDFIEEFNLEAFKQQLEGQQQDFMMKGNILTQLSNDPNAPHYNLILLVTVIEDFIFVNALKHMPLSEM